MTKTNKKRRQTSETTPRGAIMSALPGVAAAMVTAIAMILIFGLIALFCPDPRAVARIAGYATLYLSAFLGGLYAYRCCRAYALLCGLYTGLFYTALTLILSLVIRVDGAGVSPMLAFLLRLPTVAAAIGGAMAGAYTPKRHHRRRR